MKNETYMTAMKLQLMYADGLAMYLQCLLVSHYQKPRLATRLLPSTYHTDNITIIPENGQNKLHFQAKKKNNFAIQNIWLTGCEVYPKCGFRPFE